MIEIDSLTKRYGPLIAVDALTLAVEPGEIFGFLGPNGAGKTTTICMMMGLLRPTSGTVRLGGFDLLRQPEEAKAITGFLPDHPFLYDKLTGGELLRFVGGLYGIPEREVGARSDEMLERFGLRDRTHELTEAYSHGMKQRLALAAALLHRPRILVLDEPMVGLDPRGAVAFRRLLDTLRREGLTIFLSTHSLDVAEELCDRVAVIDHGRLQAVGTIPELHRRFGIDVAPSGESRPLEDLFLRITSEPAPSELPPESDPSSSGSREWLGR